ncbi:MAG: hypothetical protein ABI821_17165 [Pseudomonadota bacterium]
MREMKRVAALLVALVAASPLTAQTILPHPDPASVEREGVNKGDSARRTMDAYAKCMLGRRRALVFEALALPSGSMEQGNALGKLVGSECIASGELRFNAPAFLGSFYTSLVRAQFARKAPSFGPEPVDYTKQPIAGADSPLVPPNAELLNFASCVIHKDAVNARDAIVAAAGSPKEVAATNELAKVYGQCLYADQEFRFSKGSLIGLLAEAYYREGTASAQRSGAP